VPDFGAHLDIRRGTGQVNDLAPRPPRNRWHPALQHLSSHEPRTNGSAARIAVAPMMDWTDGSGSPVNYKDLSQRDSRVL
jgi:hypothetical protein